MANGQLIGLPNWIKQKITKHSQEIDALNSNMQDLITPRIFSIIGVTFATGYNNIIIPWEEQEWYDPDNYDYVVTGALPYVSADITCIGWSNTNVRCWSDKSYTAGYQIGVCVLQIAKFAE